MNKEHYSINVSKFNFYFHFDYYTQDGIRCCFCAQEASSFHITLVQVASEPVLMSLK